MLRPARVCVITIAVCFVLATMTIGVTGQEQEHRPPSRGKGIPPKVISDANRCSLSVSSLPAFVGVSIGMNYEDVAAVYREIENDKHFHKTFGRDGSGLFSAQSKDLDSPAKDDTVQIDLNFRDRSIQILHLVYPPDKWKSIADAVSDLSVRIGVEEKMWEIHNGESAILKCTDFKFYANSQGEETRRQNTMSIHPDTAKAN